MIQEIPAEISPAQRRRERLVVLTLAAVQFTTIVDFMIVMPLGPQLMKSLKIGPAEFGLIVSSYTFAAGAAGLIASSIVDRFARRSTFMILYAGFCSARFCARWRRIIWRWSPRVWPPARSAEFWGAWR